MSLWRAAALSVLAAGCSLGRGEPAPPMEPVTLHTPHWDQVCRDAFDWVPLRLQEVVELDPPPAPPQPLETPAGSEAPEPFVELGVNYDVSGAIRTAHLQDHNLIDPAVAELAARELRRSVRPQGQLLDGAQLRLRWSGDRVPELTILPPETCSPHIAHEAEEPPQLPSGVWLRNGRLFRGGDPEGPEVALRLHISAAGKLENVEFQGGNPQLLPRARDVVDTLEYDPALVNREAVDGTLDVILGFREGGR